VQDQIRLWELEKNRLQSDDGTSDLFIFNGHPRHDVDAVSCHRLPLHRLPLTRRLRVCAPVCEAAWRRDVGELGQAVFLRRDHWACKPEGVYLTEDPVMIEHRCTMYMMQFECIEYGTLKMGSVEP
jgi:hypothetical protein